MLAIEAVRRVRRLPIVMLLGLVLMAVGGLLDAVIHLDPVAHHETTGLVAGHEAHVLGIAGMALVLAGVVNHGVRHHHRRRAATQGGLDTNAHR